jgi:predicted  nucleic acid-binding Zn-ribbon protein
MHVIMEALVEIQKLEFRPDAETAQAIAGIEKLRSKVPPQILGHYDRLRARGKKGLALVRNNKVCSECNMQVPIGTVITILKGADIQLCGNCGRYLFVDEAPMPEVAPVVPAAAPDKPKRGRKPKKKAESDVG